MVRRRRGGLAGVGSWIHGLSAWFGHPRQEPNSCCRICRRRYDYGSSVDEPAARRETSCRSARHCSGPCRANFAAIQGGVAALSRSRDTAGLCGEVLYRGLAMAILLHPGLLAWGWVLISYVWFGMA